MLTSLFRTLMLAGALAITTMAPRFFSVDVSGTWELFHVVSEQIEIATVALDQDEINLEGTYEGTFGNATLVGSVNINEVEFSFAADQSSILCTGKVKGLIMRGTCDDGNQLAVFRGNKIN